MSDAAKQVRPGAAELLALRRKFHTKHYLDETETRRMDKLIFILAKKQPLDERIEELEKFVKRVKNRFEQHGVDSERDLRLLNTAEKLLIKEVK